MRLPLRHLQTLLLCIALLAPNLARAIDWPQEIDAPEGTLVMYQPQPEKLQGNILSGRAAISIQLTDAQEPIFGALWFSARIDTDRDAGIALVRDLKVTRVGWPDSTDAGEQRLTAIVEAQVPATGFEISLERLSASLATAEVEQESLQDLKSEPPRILFSEQLAVLLLYDGKPRFSPVEDSPFERALNTPFLVVKDTRSSEYFLGDGSQWYTAGNAMGPWKPDGRPPADLLKMIDAPADAPPGAGAADIITATEPTELIATDGTPNWKSLPGGELLYVENTETPWLRVLNTGNMYVLLSGRWFRAKSQDGPWTFVPATELPDAFKNIPPASDIGGLRASVAGTEEAEDALLDASIPQTAAIDRKSASLNVEYDGKPEFEKIAGTEVAYAVNTGAQVLKIKGHYYAVDDGVWFESDAATGPWRVADTVPSEEIAKIPPSSPVYNTTHVHIYESTPEIVYVGYTPGYLWSFPHYGVPVYGTGWYYPPYWGRYYYPRPPTWGLHVGYNPWSGWNFGVSWSNGFFSLGMSWGGGYGPYRPWGCCGGWYGGGYRGPTIINTGDINIGNNVNVGNRVDIGDRLERNPSLKDRAGERNLYQRAENRTRVADKATARESLKQARPADDRANNVYADRNGNVARRVGDDWESRTDGKWERDTSPGNGELAQSVQDKAPAAKDRVSNMDQQQRAAAAQKAQASRETVSRPASMPQQRSNIDRSGLNRAHQARSSGTRREAQRPSRMGNTRRR